MAVEWAALPVVPRRRCKLFWQNDLSISQANAKLTRRNENEALAARQLLAAAG
jgi:hypothetical protein